MKKKKENILIFDIGSASVGGAVVTLEKDEKPTVVFSTRSQMAFQEELDFKHFVHSMLTVLLNVGMELRSGGIPKIEGGIDRVLCVLSSPWYISQTKVFDINKDKSFKITDDLLNDLIQEAKKSHGKDAVQVEGNPVFIEESIIQSKINGYPVDDSSGHETDHLDITIYTAIMSLDVHERIKKMINKVFNVDDFIFKSFTSASYGVIRDLFQKEKNFLLVDVSGEMTNVSVIHDTVLHDSASFPIGHNFYTRSIQKEGYDNHDEMVSRLRMSDPTLDGILTKVNEEWSNTFITSLIEISKSTPLPPMLFLTGGSEYVQLFKKAIENTNFSDVLFVPTPFLVSVLDIKQLKPCCTFVPKTHNDAFLTLAAIYMNRYLFASENS